jgi:hypothetical protein
VVVRMVAAQRTGGWPGERTVNQDPTPHKRPFISELVSVGRPTREQTLRTIRISVLLVLVLGFLSIFSSFYGITLWYWLRLLIVPATLIGSVLLITRSIENAQGRADKRVVEAEKRVETAPQQSKPAWDLARATLDQYFQRNLGQIRAIFLLSVIVMLVGFGVICFGVLRAFQSPAALLPATIASLAGVITEFIGATFLFIYRSAIQQAVDYSKSLERINSVGMAMQILDTMPDPGEPDDLKSKTKATLVELLVQQAYEGSQGDRQNTSN